MSNTYKPFACPEHDCGQSFASEDRLNVHVVSHQSTTLRLLTLPSCVVDQTPTPTRFLRNCDEIGLFQEINPFDKDFKKALECQQQSTLVVEPEESTENDGLEVLASSADYINSPVQTHLQLPPHADDVTTLCDASANVTACCDVTPATDDVTTVSHDATTTTDTPVSLTLGLTQYAASLSQPVPPATNTVLVSQPVPHPVNSQLAGQPVAPASTSLAVSQPGPLVTPSNALVQVMVRLPTGQTVPVQLPANVILPALSTAFVDTLQSPASPPSSSVAPPGVATQHTADVLRDFASVAVVARQQSAVQPLPDVSAIATTSGNSNLLIAPKVEATTECGLTALGIAASTRQKLKATVQTMQQQRPTTSKVKVTSFPRHTLADLSNPSPVIAQKVPRLSSPVAIASSLLGSAAAVAATDVSIVQFEAADTSSTYSHATYFGGSSKSSSDDDSADRRKRYLESNRAAANRCRQKKKQWVSSLETKANELEKMNHRLQKETRALKHEIHQLKLLLLQHKDCPAMTSNSLFVSLIPQTAALQNLPS